jgi:hypothetical protein
MKKLLAISTALVLVSTAAFATGIPLFTGPWDPGNALGALNNWVLNTLNPNVTQLAASLPAPVTTGGATIETDFQYTIPANALQTGQNFKVNAWGVNDGTAQARTLTFSFGGSTCALVVTGTSAKWTAEFNVTETGSKTQSSECHATQGTTAIASVQATNWTVDNTAAIAVLVEQTAASSGTMTLNESWMQYVR